MDYLGKVCLVELHGVKPKTLNNLRLLKKQLLETCKLIDAKVVRVTHKDFGRWGISVTVIICESHISIHTWPEKKYAIVDMMTCGKMNYKKGYDHLVSVLQPTKYKIRSYFFGKFK